MQSFYDVPGKSLIEKYARQVVRSHLSRRAAVAVTDRDICKKNVVELKSYFASSLTSRLLPDIESAAIWIEEISEKMSGENPSSGEHSSTQEASEILMTLRGMASLLTEVQEFAQLEAGICPDMPETLEIDDVVRIALASTTHGKGSVADRFIHEPSSEPLHMLGYPAKLNQCLSNLIKYAYQHVDEDQKITLQTRRHSEFELMISIRYEGDELTETNIQQSLTSNNLVEHLIAIGAEHPKMALPIAYALVEIHSGKIDMRNTLDGSVEIRVFFPVHEAPAFTSDQDHRHPLSASC